MKLTITHTYTATKTTCSAVLKRGDTFGLFVEKGDVKPLYVWDSYAWIQANPRKVIYLLDDEEITETLK